jgi:phosphoribosylglycinamide formyltransferase-1
VNIHPSLLPSFPGITAVEQALNYGVKCTGVTVHYVDEGMDTGEIIAQQPIYIEKWDTEDTLHIRLQKIEHLIYPETINFLLKER